MARKITAKEKRVARDYLRGFLSPTQVGQKYKIHRILVYVLLARTLKKMFKDDELTFKR